MKTRASGKVYDNPTPSAFIFYRARSKALKEMLFYNEEAFRILSFHFCPPGEEASFPDISSLCLAWKGLLDKRLKRSEGDGKGMDPEAELVDTIKSYRRQYAVRGIILSGQESEAQGQKQYLFVLERMSPEKMNLAMIFRNLGLSKREQEIVRLLLAGAANKEIADSLGLALNTVNGYMKLLMRKLGVSNRAGIIGVILSPNAGENR